MTEDPLFGYRGYARTFLINNNIKVGDRVRVKKLKENFTVEGIVMPRSLLAEDGFIEIKLDNGYNIGIRITDDTVVEKVKEERREFKGGLIVPEIPKPKPGLPKVSIISTGGTIASKVDYRTGAVYPALTSEDLYRAVPEIANIAYIEAEVLFSIFSENMTPKHWEAIAQHVADKVREGFDGVVVTHGTDTMGYTAAALSFALQDLPVPVVLVGAQRSSDRPSSDAAINLYSAVKVAAEAPFAEVVVVMHGSISDDYCLAHRGTKVRKMHTSRRDAFRTVNDIPLAKIYKDRIEILSNNYRRRDKSRKLKLKNKFDDKVVLIKVYPGMKSDIIDYIVDSGYHGIVLEGTGLGHTPESLFPAIKRAIREGIPVVMTSQCIWGRINMNVYSTGRELLSFGVIPGEDMLPETAYVKLSWILAQTRDLDEIRKLMLTNIAGEINPRSLISYYPPLL